MLATLSDHVLSVSDYLVKTVHPHTEVTQQAQYSLNSIPFEISQNYKLFESKYEQHSIILPDGDKWTYYDTGSGILSQAPLILIPGTTGTAQVFFQQLLSLGLRGYRLISVTIPNTSTVQLFIKSFNRFLHYLNIDELHLLGTSLGGYLALSFTALHPSRVLSLILTNSFINTRLFQANAPWISSDVMPEFYLRRYITQALPTNKQQSIQMALATDFVLQQVNSLSKDELSARLTLNFSKHCVDKLNYPQEHITIIDVYDGTALDQGMKDQLYQLLNQAKYSLMKYGGDFPYLSNYEEYSMLIQVHLRRQKHSDPDPITTITKMKVEKKIKNVDSEDISDIGVFDHRRNYHNTHKASLFRDNEEDQKDGVILEHFASDSSQSSDMMMMDIHHHTEHDKRKSHLMSNRNYEPQTEANNDGNIMNENEKAESEQHDVIHMDFGANVNIDVNYSECYTINEEKKKQYLIDRKIKKKRYKEYLARKKKAYKKYLMHKGKIKENEDKTEAIAPSNKKKHKKRKHKIKHSSKKKHSKKKKKKKKRKQLRQKKVSNIESVERRREKMLEYYHEKKMKLESDDENEQKYEDEQDHRQEHKNEYDENKHEHEPNVSPLMHNDDIHSVEETEIIHMAKDNMNNLDIVEVGSNLISPRHSFTEEDNNHNNNENVSVVVDRNSDDSSLPEPQPTPEAQPLPHIQPEAALAAAAAQHKYEAEPQPAAEPEIKRVSKHRVLRAKHRGLDDNDNNGLYDHDQTPMDLIPTTVAGHRYIPSYDSTISVNHFDDDHDDKQEELPLDRIRSDSYVAWNPSNRRQDSYISELGDYDFRASEVVPYIAGYEGNHIHDSAANLNGYTPISADAYSSQASHNKFPSNASLYFVSKQQEPENGLLDQHKVDEDDENVGDSIF